MDVPLESTSAQKYLGVQINSSLDWSVHINTIATQANTCKTLVFFEDTSDTAPQRLKRLPSRHS